MGTSRHVDSRGRVSLGQEFANRTVIIETVDATEVRVILSRVIPERELWLQENEGAKALVEGGLRQAAKRQFSKKPPDMKKAARLAKQLKDE